MPTPLRFGGGGGRPGMNLLGSRPVVDDATAKLNREAAERRRAEEERRRREAEARSAQAAAAIGGVRAAAPSATATGIVGGAASGNTAQTQADRAAALEAQALRAQGIVPQRSRVRAPEPAPPPRRRGFFEKVGDTIINAPGAVKDKVSGAASDAKSFGEDVLGEVGIGKKGRVSVPTVETSVPVNTSGVPLVTSPGGAPAGGFASPAPTNPDVFFGSDLGPQADPFASPTGRFNAPPPDATGADLDPNTAATFANPETAAAGRALLLPPDRGRPSITNPAPINLKEGEFAVRDPSLVDTTAGPSDVGTTDPTNELNQLLLARARGEGPSAADLQQQAGLEDAMRQQIALSTAQSGVSAGAALRGANEAGIALQRQTIADAAQRRADEQATAQGLLGQQLLGLRGQDIEREKLAANNALQSRSLQLQEMGLSQSDAHKRMAMDLQAQLANAGFAVDLEKLRVTTELASRGMDLELAMAQAGIDANMKGGRLQLVANIIGAVA